MPPIRYNKNELGVFQNGADCAETERKFIIMHDHHDHVHPHAHDHEHHHHDHDHHHDHTCHSGCDHHHCEACSQDPKAELIALMNYMVKHNTAHAAELEGLAKQLKELGENAAYEQILLAVSDFEKGNLRLSTVLAAIK